MRKAKVVLGQTQFGRISVRREPFRLARFERPHMLPFYSLSFVMLLACASLYYRIGQFEGGSGVAWAGLSVLISVVVWRLLGWGWLGILASQLMLFGGIGVFRTLRNREPEGAEPDARPNDEERDDI